MSSALIYKMRLTAPNKPGTASHNSNYVKYIAEREHVMKLSPESESGLFGRIDGANNDELNVADTQNYVYGISKAGVTVYNAYISFRPEIAKRLELDSLEKWQNYIKVHIETLMRGYDIPKDRLEYIAAVHDKKGQPHIHISFWDKDPPVTVQFVKKEVSDNVRKKLIHDANGNFSAEQMQKVRLEMMIAKIIDFIKEKFTQLYQSMKAYANLYISKLPAEPEEDISPEDVKDAQLFTLMKRAYDKMNDNYEDFEEMSFDEKVDSIMKEFERVNENERTHTVAKSNELIPEGTEKLEERCFSDRKDISDVVIPGSIREIPYMAFASSSVKTAVIEPGVESISSCAFAATDLESISIPDTVKHIGEQAFAMTDITSIEIPASVKAIGYLAFNGCRNLKEVTMSKGTIFDKDTFPEGINIRYRENEQEQSEPEEEEGFEPEI